MPQELLELAQKYISQGWTQRYHAVDDSGSPVLVGDKNAAAWCIMGALIEANRELIDTTENYLATHNPARDFLNAISLLSTEIDDAKSLDSYVKATQLNRWNDESGRNVNEVLQVFNQAINNSIKVEPSTKEE